MYFFSYEEMLRNGNYLHGNLLDLSDLNTRIKRWNFGCKETIRITPIKKEYLKEKGSIHMNAKEIAFIVENLPFLLRAYL